MFIEGWSIEGLRKVVWPNKVKGEKVTLRTPPEAFKAEVYGGNSFNLPTKAMEDDETQHILR